MESPVVPNPTVRRVRCWRVPPPLTRGAELLEGAEVLSELPDEAGVIVWKSLRNVTLWAAAAPGEQGELFAERSEERRRAELATVAVDPGLVAPLEAVAALLGDPAGTQREAVALACRLVAQWAEARQASATALAFTQAASLACPHDPRLALAVGRLARGRAENSRSESWFRRAIMLGRQSGDWETYALAYLGLGTLFFHRGNFPLARRAHIKGLRAARRKGLRGVAGMAYHDLMAIEVESENASRAQDYAAAALRAYGKGHPRLPALAHDAAALWLLQGEFARALPVFEAVLPHLDRPADRMGVLSNIARAAAGADRAEVYRDAWSQVWNAALAGDAGAGCAQALLNLAHGASLLGEWDRAQESADHAARIATARGEAQVRLEAEALLDAVRTRRTVQARVGHPRSTQDEQGELLAQNLVRYVRRGAVSV